MHWSAELSAWLALDAATVETVLTTPPEYSANRLLPVYGRLKEKDRASAADVMRWLSLWLPFQDPPNHTRIRKHLNAMINPRIAKTLRGPVREITVDLLDGLPKGEAFDFFQDFGLKLPGYVVMDMLGVPRDRIPEVKQWSDEMMLFIGSARNVEDKYEKARHGALAMAALFTELIEERRVAPRDDILTRMITHEVEGETLTDDELVASMMAIGNGAQETTAHLISNSLLALLANPAVLEELRADPGKLTPAAIDEFLRFDGPVLSTGRIVTQDTELGGQWLAEGERVFAVLAAANRDPSVVDDPDKLDLGRAPNPHMAFGKGVHFCLGAPVARLEAEIALSEILSRFSDFRLAEPRESILWVNSLVARGPSRLPLEVR